MAHESNNSASPFNKLFSKYTASYSLTPRRAASIRPLARSLSWWRNVSRGALIYWSQRFNKFMQLPSYTLPALAKGEHNNG